ncbi:Uncharacterised protein [Salmonella enterica subsp. enterica serovar Typhimurium]|nr:Uncharacterised protein [Salmonella enterica subsp. enterica serovar Typhimurium]
MHFVQPMQLFSSITASIRTGAACCSSPSHGCGSTFSNSGNFQHDGFAAGRATIDFSRPGDPRLRRRGGSRDSRTDHTGSAAKSHRFFQQPDHLQPRIGGRHNPEWRRTPDPEGSGANGNPDSIHYNFTKPLKPIKAKDINPAVINAIALPRKGAGTSATARRSRIAANRTITNEKPTAAENPYSAD